MLKTLRRARAKAGCIPLVTFGPGSRKHGKKKNRRGFFRTYSVGLTIQSGIGDLGKVHPLVGQNFISNGIDDISSVLRLPNRHFLAASAFQR